VVAENLLDVLSKPLLGGDGAMVHNSCILEGPRYQEEMATLNGGLSDILSKDGTKLPNDAVEATAVDQAKSRFQSQILPAKIGDLESKCVCVSGGEAASARNRRRAIVEAQDRKALVSQPTTNLTASATQVDDALIFWQPAGLYRINDFLLRLVGFPERIEFGVEPAAFPSVPVSQMRPLGK
jgi:hypothetical protein